MPDDEYWNQRTGRWERRRYIEFRRGNTLNGLIGTVCALVAALLFFWFGGPMGAMVAILLLVVACLAASLTTLSFIFDLFKR